MPPTEFEPTIPVNEPPQIYVLDRAATRAGRSGGGVPLILSFGIK